MKIKVDSYDSLPIEKILTLHDAVIRIKSVLNNDKNHYYYKIFLEKFPYQLAKKQSQICVHRIIMVRFRDREIAKKNLCCKRPIKIWDVKVDNIVISKLVKTKTNSMYLIGYLDKITRPLVLLMPKMS